MDIILSVLQELRELSGNSQLFHLQYKKSDLLKQVLEYTYDPHKLFKIDEGKYAKLDNEPVHAVRANFTQDDWNYFVDKLNYLCSIKSAKDEDVETIISFINDFDEVYRDFLKKVLFKDLRLNMSVKKFQKVWPGFCEEPQVQLANKRESQTFNNGLYSRKFDGKRMYIMNNIPYSRSNIECYKNPVQHIINQVSNMINDQKLVLDGECLYFDNGVEDFQKGISLCQSEERKDGCDNICYVIFDMIPNDNFINKTSYKPFNDVYEDMITKYANDEKSSPDYSLIPTNFDNIFIARQDKDMTKLSELCTKNNWEGLMYRNGDSPYEFKRTKNLLKIKKMEDIELKLIDMQEGTGRHSGRLGAFIVEYEGGTVNIGSGFTDEQRQEYWNNRDKYIGEYVKTQYFEKTINQDGQHSLRFPVFLCFRNSQTNEEFLIK